MYLEDLRVVAVTLDEELHDHLLAEQKDIVISTGLTTPAARHTSISKMILARP